MKKARMVGRGGELERFDALISETGAGKGRTLLVSGEAGIGKTHFISECRRHAVEAGFKVISGAGSSASLEPFQLFLHMFEPREGEPPIFLRARKSISTVFLVNRAGLLIAMASNEENPVDADIVAGMMAAVNSFVKDSLASKDDAGADLDRLEFGDMKIIIEHGQSFFLTAVLRGSETTEIREVLKSAFKVIEGEHGETLASWNGNMAEVRPVQEMVESLVRMKFMVRQDLASGMLENERNRISDIVLRSTQSLVADSPVLMVLEDLHWADDSSLFVLNYLARNITRERVMILGTMRPGESALLSAWLAKMKSEEIFDELPLGALGLTSVSELVDELYPGNGFQESFIVKLAENCAGNPFFITELLGQMASDGHIAEKAGRPILMSEDYALPIAIGDFVGQKLEALAPDVIVMLEYASCIGVRFEEQIIRSYGESKGIDDALEQLISTGIVECSGTHCEFTHAIFQDAVYRGMGERWRAAHHKNIGEYYEKAYADMQVDGLYQLAWHFSRSSEHAKAYGYCVRAAEKAEAEYDPLRALDFYMGALAAVRKVGKAAEPGAAPKLMEKVGEIQMLTGAFDDAIKTLTAASEKAENTKTRVRLLRSIATALEWKGELDAALTTLEEALALVSGERSIEYGRLRIREGNIYIKKGNRTRALALLEEAHAVFLERNAGPGDIANVLSNLSTLHYRNGDLDKAMEYQLRAIDIFRSIGDESGIANTLTNMGNTYQSMGKYRESIECYEQSATIQQRRGILSHLPGTLANLGNTYYKMGEFDKAIEYHNKSLVVKERFGHKWGIAASSLTIGVIHYARGELDLAMEMYQRSFNIWEGMSDKQGLVVCLNNMGEVYLMRDDFRNAFEMYTRALDIAEKSNEKINATSTLCGLALTNVGLGDVNTAMAQAKKALGIAFATKSKSQEGKCAFVLGTVLREMGELDASEETFTAAIRTLEESNTKGELAFAHYEFGLLLKSAGRTGEAKLHLGKSLDMFGEMGMRLWRERAAKALEGL